MKKSLLIGVLMATILAFGHVSGLNAIPQDSYGYDPDEAKYGQLKRIIHKSQKDVARFGELLDKLNEAARESSNASRHNAVGQILHEMVQEIRQVHDKLEKKYFLPDEMTAPKVYASDPVPEGSAAVFSSTHARLATMEEIYRVCNQMQEPAIQKQGRVLNKFIEKSQEFYGFMQEEYRVTRSLLPAKYQEAGNGLSY